MKLKNVTFGLIFSLLTTTCLATTFNLLAFEPIPLTSKLFSCYYSKVATDYGYVVTFPLKYQEQTNLKLLSSGVQYRTYLTEKNKGFYIETNAYFDLVDTSGPDTFSLTPNFVVGYKIDTNKGIFVEPEGLFYLPITASTDSSLTVASKVDSLFRIVLGLDNIWPNGFFLAPRVTFSYTDNDLKATGRLFIGYGF